jgi:hypothetical protein
VQYFQGFAIFHDCQGGEGVPLVDTLWNILLVESRGEKKVSTQIMNMHRQQHTFRLTQWWCENPRHDFIPPAKKPLIGISIGCGSNSNTISFLSRALAFPSNVTRRRTYRKILVQSSHIRRTSNNLTLALETCVRVIVMPTNLWWTLATLDSVTDQFEKGTNHFIEFLVLWNRGYSSHSCLWPWQQTNEFWESFQYNTTQNLSIVGNWLFCCLNYELPPECECAVTCQWDYKPQISNELLIESKSPYLPWVRMNEWVREKCAYSTFVTKRRLDELVVMIQNDILLVKPSHQQRHSLLGDTLVSIHIKSFWQYLKIRSS